MSFLREAVSVVSRNSRLLVVMNWLFFGVILVGSLLAQAGYFGVQESPLGDGVLPIDVGSLPVAIAEIFLNNLIVSGFLLVTLSGLLFFAFPVVFLAIRGLLWGALITALPTSSLLLALPTLLLEGEGYVLASVAGINLGLSWLRPNRVYKVENLSRPLALRKALLEAARIFVLVAILLFLGAVVEALTIALTG